ncbi:MAG: flavin reductase [Planctomycetaceae bacterium]|nr:flavin reductase [Planctomycetaceae bacterium]
MLDQIAAVLGRTPSGLFIVTARNAEGQETGLLASWVQQAAFDPPAVTVAVNRKRYIHTWLADSPRLAFNLLGESQKNFLGHFGKGFEPGEPAFEGLHIDRTPTGLPVLSDALGWMEGDVIGSLEAGDHIIYLVQLTAAKAGSDLESHKPWVHIRKNGLGY